MKHRKVAIIGGSLVGPAMYRFLDRVGIHDVTVYEALRQPHSQSGGVMGLRPETLDVLNLIGVNTNRAAALSTGAVLSYDITAAGRATYRGTAMFPGPVVSWDGMYGALATNTPVLFGHRLTNIVPDGRRYDLTFANGKEDTADVVLFADGRKSTGRDLIDPARPLRYNGYTVWRGLADVPSGEWRPRGFERFYDTEAGRLFSITEPILFGPSAGKSYWELSHNLSATEYARLTRGRAPTDLAYILPGQITDTMHDVMKDAADRLPEPLRNAVVNGEASGIPVNDVTMPSRVATVSAGGATAVLLGDALIPVRLQVGAGLNQGLAQAAEVADVLAETDLATAFDRWQASALDRLAPIVELGRSRAHRINLGMYEAVQPGRTAVPENGGAFDTPVWVTA